LFSLFPTTFFVVLVEQKSSPHLGKNRKYPLDLLHFNADKEICKPQKLYTGIFGQHDPGKAPMGKTSRRGILLWISQANIATRKQHKGT
jgi:hypothetical protein